MTYSKYLFFVKMCEITYSCTLSRMIYTRFPIGFVIFFPEANQWKTAKNRNQRAMPTEYAIIKKCRRPMNFLQFYKSYINYSASGFHMVTYGTKVLFRLFTLKKRWIAFVFMSTCSQIFLQKFCLSKE